MENYLLLLLGFATFIGVSYLIYKLTMLYPEESAVLSAILIVLLILAGGFLNNINLFIPLIYTAAFAGLFLMITGLNILKMFRPQKTLKKFFSPAICVLILIFLYGTFCFSQLLLFNGDDFTQWGLAVKYMAKTQLLPYGPSYSGSSANPPGLPLFNYFFTTFTGYIEGNLYVSNQLFVWLPLMLPFAGYNWRNWKKVLLFSVLVYIAIFSLTWFTYISLFVDLAQGFWAGGICAWWLKNRERKNVFFLPLLIILLLPFLKRSVGIIFAYFVIFFMLTIELVSYNKSLGKTLLQAFSKFRRLSAWLSIGILVIPLILSYIWGQYAVYGRTNDIDATEALFGNSSIFDTFIQILTLSTQKALLTVNRGITALTVKDMTRFSALQYSYLQFIAASVLYSIPVAYLIKDRIKKRIFISAEIFFLVGAAVFFAINIYSYIAFFDFYSSVNMVHSGRYFSLFTCFGFLWLLMPLFEKQEDEILPKEEKKKFLNTNRLKAAIAGVLILLFCTGFNQNFVALTSQFHSAKIPDYPQRLDVRMNSDIIKKYVSADEKMYVVGQNISSLIALCLSYELEKRFSDKQTCYYFSDDTDIAAARGMPYLSINDLPDTLADQGYQYLWIYRTDNYFNVNFKLQFDMDAEQGVLFSVKVQDGRVKLNRIVNIEKVATAGS